MGKELEHIWESKSIGQEESLKSSSNYFFETNGYLSEIQLVLLEWLLLGNYTQNPAHDHVSIKYQSLGIKELITDMSIEDCATKGIDLLGQLESLENIVGIEMPLELTKEYPAEQVWHFNSVHSFRFKNFDISALFLKDYHRFKENDSFFDKVKKICPWLFNACITITNTSFLKEKINEFLNKYVTNYENKVLVGANVISQQRHDDFFLKLFDSLKNLDQRNLFIDSEIISNNLTDFYSSNIEAKGQMKLLEHFLLYEKQGNIKIKDIDFSEVGSKIPWVITIEILRLLNEVKLNKNSTELINKQPKSDSSNFYELHFDEDTGALIYGDKSCEFSFNTAEYCILQAIFEKPKGKKLRKLELAYHYEEQVEKDTKDETIYQATLRINKKTNSKLGINKLIEYENGLYWLKEF